MARIYTSKINTCFPSSFIIIHHHSSSFIIIPHHPSSLINSDQTSLGFSFLSSCVRSFANQIGWEKLEWSLVGKWNQRDSNNVAHNWWILIENECFNHIKVGVIRRSHCGWRGHACNVVVCCLVCCLCDDGWMWLDVAVWSLNPKTPRKCFEPWLGTFQLAALHLCGSCYRYCCYRYLCCWTNSIERFVLLVSRFKKKKNSIDSTLHHCFELNNSFVFSRAGYLQWHMPNTVSFEEEELRNKSSPTAQVGQRDWH